jgi:CubicO group peptidase (beta-lactamase class C family)
MRRVRWLLPFTLSLLVPSLLCTPAGAVAPPPGAAPAIPAALRARIDEAATQVLAATGAPSASIAIARDGRILYAQAYGEARLGSAPARPGLRYHIGSVSKQFTAVAVLLLVEQGALSLDDPVARFFPDLTRAREVTIRHLLSHTSGYQDYWPQDYVPPFMLRDVKSDEILQRWARGCDPKQSVTQAAAASGCSWSASRQKSSHQPLARTIPRLCEIMGPTVLAGRRGHVRASERGEPPRCVGSGG